ncbi:MAG: hypothetical protein CMP20_15315 [Rickettsiales bacterium]|nr:hypothetical protein [Rickettsiales bacterium]
MRLLALVLVMGLLAVSANAQYGTVCCQCSQGGFGQQPQYVSAADGNCGMSCNVICGTDEVDAVELESPNGNVNLVPGTCQNTIEDACPTIDLLTCEQIVDVSNTEPYASGEQIILSATIAGGLMPYTCLWVPSVLPGTGPMDGCQEVVYSVNQNDIDAQSVSFTVQVIDAGGISCNSSALILETSPSPPPEEFMGCCDLTESIVYEGTEPSACTTQAGCVAWGGVFNDQAECKFDSQCSVMPECDIQVTCCVADEFGEFSEQLLSVSDCVDLDAVTITLSDQGMCPENLDSVANECCFEDEIITIDQSFTISDCLDNDGKIVENAQACECATTLAQPPGDLSCCECQCIDTSGSTPSSVTRWVAAEDCAAACASCPSGISDCTLEGSTPGNFIDQGEQCFDTQEDACIEMLVTGACCINDACMPETTQNECVNELSGMWIQGVDCENNPCGPQPLQSYCCVCETPNNGGTQSEPACVQDSPFDPNGFSCGSGGLGTYSMCVPNDCTTAAECATMPTPPPTPAPTPPTPPPTPAPTPTPGACDPEVEIVCNAAFTGDCNVAGSQNLEERLVSMNDRLDQLENA